VPKEGFRSVTMSMDSYDRIYRAYEASGASRGKAGTRSLSAYVVRLMEAELKRADVFARHRPWIKFIAIEDGVAILRDNMAGSIVEVAVRAGELDCKSCHGDACLHVGFLLSVPQVYWLLEPDVG